MMTSERAKQIAREIWTNNPLGGHRVEQTMTEAERQEIIKFWHTLPGHTCFFDAVNRMARGDHLVQAEKDARDLERLRRRPR